MTSAPIDPARPSRGLSLNDVLNVLWRRRLLIVTLTLLGAVAGILYGWLVTPLYLATATVTPGITHFDAQAQPVREWLINDVVQWYKRGDYNPTLAVLMGQDPVVFQPIIRASYIPRSPQSRGGNTITITTLFPDPEVAERILSSSVRVFNAFAGSDTAFSDIHLMRVRIETNITKQKENIRQLESKNQSVELQIQQQKQQKKTTEKSIDLVEGDIAELRSARQMIELTRQAYEDMLAQHGRGMEDLQSRLARWERDEQRWTAQRDSLAEVASRGGPVEALLYANSLGTLVREIGDLRLGMFEESARALRWQDRIQALERERNKTDRDIQKKEFERDQTIPNHIRELDKKIAELELQRDYDLVGQETDLQQELRAMQSRLASLLPLEQVGDAVSSAKPVRPRKRRAIQILVVLGFSSSIFLAFTLEYLSRNWREITRSSPMA